MDAAHTIREAVNRVAQLRQTVADSPGLAQAVSDIKHFQARRFAGTYVDLLGAAPYQPAVLFFLEELYSDKDYSQRDAQFSRIAGGLERLFPQQVVDTAVALAQLHRLTEELDLSMAQCWREHSDLTEVTRYLVAWRAVGRRADRDTQLATVLHVGEALDRLTRTPGLRRMLKLMARPAKLMGMASLQRFLELGFDTFAAMGQQGDGAAYFLATVQTREAGLMARLFETPLVTCGTELVQILANRPVPAG